MRGLFQAAHYACVRRLLTAGACAFALTLAAAGPDAVARADRSLWPEPLATPAAFDRASRAEILSFATALAEFDGMDAPALAQRLKIKSANLESVKAWRTGADEHLLANFRSAAASCAIGELFCFHDMSAALLKEKAAALDAGLPEKFRGWRDDARQFHRLYATEQLRLAALFPKPTSEILSFSPREKNGFELGDREFLLTFDDGPTAQGGTTDALLAALNREGVHGLFYMLGERLQARQLQEKPEALQHDYAGMCVAAHGWTHVSHQSLPDWQRSVSDTGALLKQSFGPLYKPLFRPPYGQRKADSGPWFTAQGLTVALWNIDSQDWNARLTAPEAGGRVLSLMLLWRRGIILFHDVHDKARTAVPSLISLTRSSGVKWADCRNYPE